MQGPLYVPAGLELEGLAHLDRLPGQEAREGHLEAQVPEELLLKLAAEQVLVRDLFHLECVLFVELQDVAAAVQGEVELSVLVLGAAGLVRHEVDLHGLAAEVHPLAPRGPVGGGEDLLDARRLGPDGHLEPELRAHDLHIIDAHGEFLDLAHERGLRGDLHPLARHDPRAEVEAVIDVGGPSGGGELPSTGSVEDPGG